LNGLDGRADRTRDPQQPASTSNSSILPSRQNLARRPIPATACATWLATTPARTLHAALPAGITRARSSARLCGARMASPMGQHARRLAATAFGGGYIFGVFSTSHGDALEPILNPNQCHPDHQTLRRAPTTRRTRGDGTHTPAPPPLPCVHTHRATPHAVCASSHAIAPLPRAVPVYRSAGAMQQRGDDNAP